MGHIAPEKDIDGANPLSLGRLAVGQPSFAPATARAVIEILDHFDIPLAGRNVVVIGRSAVVGKPLSLLLLERDAAVTVCHSRSGPLEKYTKAADVVVVAAGRTGLLNGGHVSSEAVVIDVGTNVLPDGSLVGDVDEASVRAYRRGADSGPRRRRLRHHIPASSAHNRGRAGTVACFGPGNRRMIHRTACQAAGGHHKATEQTRPLFPAQI